MGREQAPAGAGGQQQQQSTMSYTVEQLVSVNPYNPDILPDLENYVNEQVSYIYIFFPWYMYFSPLLILHDLKIAPFFKVFL